MGRIGKLIITLLILGFIALVGYAYLGDMTPQPSEQRQQVTLPGAGSAD